jgi:hypothetical protein
MEKMSKFNCLKSYAHMWILTGIVCTFLVHRSSSDSSLFHQEGDDALLQISRRLMSAMDTRKQVDIPSSAVPLKTHDRNTRPIRCDSLERYVLDRYVPSALETWWNESIAKVSKDWDALACPKVRADHEQYKPWFSAAASAGTVSVSETQADVMSYHAYRDLCNDSALIKVPIEPLMGLLRHPNAVCTSVSDHDILRKDWLILPNAGYFDTQSKKTTTILYDIGASLYKSGFGGASQEWFVTEFAARGLSFDAIYAWEAIHHSPTDIFKDIPRDMLHKVRYYNVPVEDAPEGLHNPVRILKLSARPEDYVVLKLDIDTPKLELALMKQLLADEDALKLVDEVFFEQHTAGNPMTAHGWGNNVLGDISDSYRLFAELRARGVRAHSWV